MQNLQYTYEDIFGEIKNLLAELSNSDSYENLLTKENELNQLYQKFSFLKISKDFNFLSIQFESLEIVENQSTNLNPDLISVEKFDDENKIAEIIVEETEVHDIFDEVPEVEEVHSFEEIDEQEHSHKGVFEEVSGFTEIDSEENEFVEEVSSFDEIEPSVNQVENESDKNELVEELEDNLLQDSSQKLEPMQDSQFSFAMDKEEIKETPVEDDFEARLAEKEAKLKQLEENRRKIVELSKNTLSHEKTRQDYESPQDDHPDKKFKLANIKGLKVAKSLFDDDHLEDIEQHQPKQESGSLLKNNMPTDYMEAPKQKPGFKLDLNDRIAFSQHLFDGSQSELNQVVTVLNSLTSLDKAQEFLSDIYYERDWKKVDSYAQRLWTLVENRFL